MLDEDESVARFRINGRRDSGVGSGRMVHGEGADDGMELGRNEVVKRGRRTTVEMKADRKADAKDMACVI